MTVEVVDVTFSYRRRRVLNGASWAVGAGVTAILGPNGAGKTTLLKCIVGLAVPSSGQVSVGGRSVRDGRAAQQLIGYVPQNPSLPGLCRVRDLVAYAAWLSGVPDGEASSAVKTAMGRMQVSDLADRRVRSLSGGQRQRVALATGIVHEPQVLILDEPTVGLDPGQRLKVREVIRSIGTDRCVILSTHMTEDVEHLANAVGVLVGGKVQYQGPLSGLAVAAPDRADTRPGTPFELAYDAMMVTLGSAE